MHPSPHPYMCYSGETVKVGPLGNRVLIEYIQMENTETAGLCVYIITP